MKRAWVVAGLLLFGLSSLSADPSGVSFGVFYSSLSPHGEWIQCDGDVYAWRPFGVAVGWRPYYYGRWCWTDDGWYWASDEPWAWATYHYGRWYYDDFYGWVWIPGYDWAPAWVEWRYGGDYVGWAPLSPYAVFSVSFGLHYRSYWITPHSWWSFVDCRYVANPFVHRYVYRVENNTRYIGRTRSAGSVRYDAGRITSRGPDRSYVEQRGNMRLERAEIRDVADRPVDRVVRDGEHERVEVYRPRIDDRAAGATSIRPDRIREVDRRISLDTKGMDVRSRDADRESGREMHRSEEFRKKEDTQVQREPTRGYHQRDWDRARQVDVDRKPEVRRGREHDVERRNDPPVYNREPRKEAQRDVRQDREVNRRAERQFEQKRRDDRASSPRSQTHQEGRGGGSESRGGGRKR